MLNLLRDQDITNQKSGLQNLSDPPWVMLQSGSSKNQIDTFTVFQL